MSAVYAVALYATGVHLQHGAKDALSYLPTVLGLGVVLFDLSIWKWPGIHKFVGRPRLDGVWDATLTPNPDSHIPRGGNWGPIQAAVIIEQTYWTLNVTLFTKESASRSSAAALRRAGDSRSRNRLTYLYINEPKQENRPRSNPHGGATWLDAVGRTPAHLTGTYWTDRLTVGDMDLHFLGRSTDYSDLTSVVTAFGLSPKA